MANTYKITDYEVKHPKEGLLKKKAIVYYEGKKEVTREFYTGNPKDIRDGFEPADANQPVKQDIDIDKLSDAQILKLKQRIENLK